MSSLVRVLKQHSNDKVFVSQMSFLFTLDTQILWTKSNLVDWFSMRFRKRLSL